MSDRNVNPQVTYLNFIILNHFFTFDNILHTIQASDARLKKSTKWLLSFFTYSKLQLLTGIIDSFLVSETYVI